MRVSKHRTFLLLFVLAFVGASMPAVVRADLDFDHGMHVEDMEMECAYCHEQAETSEVGTDNLLPDGALCGDCHGEDIVSEADYSEWESHVDLFNHAVHVEQGMECSDCHRDDEGRIASVEKTECRSCHATQPSLGDCAMCHSEGAEYVPADHGAGWESWHGVEAGSANATCSNCHAQADCQQCHSGDNVRPRSHPVGYEFTHALDAQTRAADCAVCHQDNGFCVSCHAAEQVQPRNHSSANWAVPFGDGGQHSIEATLDLESCIACHDNATQPLCADCHGR